MEFILEALFSVIGELVFSLVGEILIELGFHTVVAAAHSRTHPVVSGIGYTLLGAVLGGLSLLVLPDHLIRDPALSLGYLVLSPVVAGFMMAGIGALRARRGQSLIRLDSFGCGFLFALAFAFIRWQFAG